LQSFHLSSMSWVVWFTGLPGCGKTTIVQRTKSKLEEQGVKVKVLELDEVRKVITPNPSYTDEERSIVYASLAYMAKLLIEAKTNVIVDATANKRRYRDLARDIIPQFAEVYVNVPLEVCIEREAKRRAAHSPKGIYKKGSLTGATVPGVNVTYEEPQNPEIVLDAENLDPESNAEIAAQKILETFSKHGT